MSAVDEEIVVDPAPSEVKPNETEEAEVAAPPASAAAPPVPDSAAKKADTTATKKNTSTKTDSQKKKKTATTTASSSSVGAGASTRSGAGMSTIKAGTTQKMEFTTGPHVNARYETIGDEHARFRRQQGTRPTYKGPVYVAEDVHVLCAECHTPVDPVTRVPVGSHLFYHEHCVRCAICGRRGVAEPFLEQAGQPVCAACVEKGNAPAQVRRMQPHSYAQPAPQKLTAQQQAQKNATLSRTLNQTAVQGAVPPSLQVTPHLHDTRNTTDRSFALMQRQQYFTQNDANMLTQMPPQEEKSTSTRRKESVKGVENGDTVPALE